MNFIINPMNRVRVQLKLDDFLNHRQLKTE